MSNRKLFWLVAAFALGTAGLRAQVFPGYLDTVIVPSAPANPSSTCFAGSPCARVSVVGTSSQAGLACTLPGGQSCAGPFIYLTNTATGTTCNTLTRLVNGQAQIMTNTGQFTSVASPVLGVAIAGCGTSGIVTIQTQGVVSLAMDGPTSVSHVFGVSATTSGSGSDYGSFAATAQLGSYNLGRILSTQSGAGTYPVLLGFAGVNPASAFSGVYAFASLPTCTKSQLAYTSDSLQLMVCSATNTWSVVGATLQTNGTNNSSQTTLNLQNGTNTTASNPSAGNVQVNVAAATASSLGVAQCDGTTITCSGGVITAVSGGSPPGMVRLAQQVLSSPAATVTFAGIGGSFSGLQIAVTARASASATAEDMYMQFNGDTSADYSRQYIGASGGSTGAGQTTSTAQASIVFISAANALANAPVSAEIWSPAYAGTTFRKEAFSTAGGITGSGVSGIYNQNESVDWSSTAAITSITFGVVGGSNFVTGSTFTLYALQ